MTQSNGEAKKVTEALNDSEKLDLILEALADIRSDLTEFREEVFERLNNISLSAVDYSIEEEYN